MLQISLLQLSSGPFARALARSGCPNKPRDERHHFIAGVFEHVVPGVGQPVHLLSPLVPSTYLLVSLAGVEFGDHQRFTWRWAVATCAVMAVAAALTGVFPVRG